MFKLRNILIVSNWSVEIYHLSFFATLYNKLYSTVYSICKNNTIISHFKMFLIRDVLDLMRYIKENDPAIQYMIETLFYPCLWALLLHRVAHLLFVLHIPILPRLVSLASRLLTGIEIHPGASIGRCLFIDHGMGVVIGQTAVVGDFCIIY